MGKGLICTIFVRHQSNRGEAIKFAGKIMGGASCESFLSGTFRYETSLSGILKQELVLFFKKKKRR